MSARDDLLEPVAVPEDGPARAWATGDRRRARTRRFGAGALALVVLVAVSAAVLVRPSDDGADVVTTSPATTPDDAPVVQTISVVDDGVCPPGEADGVTMPMIQTEASRELVRILNGSGFPAGFASGSGRCGLASVGAKPDTRTLLTVKHADAPTDAVATFLAAHPTSVRPDGLPPELDGAIVHADSSVGSVQLVVARPGSGTVTEVGLSWDAPPLPGTPSPVTDAQLVTLAVTVTEQPPALHPTNGPVVTPRLDLPGRSERPTSETVGGTLTYDAATKCLHVGTAAVVWPAGSQWQADPAGVVLGTTGETVLVGSTFTVPGERVPPDAAGFRAGGVAEHAALRCLGYDWDGEVAYLAVVPSTGAGPATDAAEAASAVIDPGPGPFPPPDAEAMAELSDPDALIGVGRDDGVLVGFVRNGESLSDGMTVEEGIEWFGILNPVRDRCGSQIAWTVNGMIFTLDEVAQEGFDLNAALVARGGEPIEPPG